MNGEDNIGALAAALAKAQSEFGAITRSKTVTVTSQRTGRSYTFAYAPLDTILDKVRGPLAANGLAIAQLLDAGDLVTMLMHESGARLVGRTVLPDAADIQAYGSSVTYLRRYALQSLLGIAAEEDDDGNRGVGNDAAPAKRTAPKVERDGNGLIGTVEIGQTGKADYELRQTPSGWHLAFRLVSPQGGIKVEARDALAQDLFTSKADIVGERVTCWGRIEDQEFTPAGKRKPVVYQVLNLERISVPDLGVLPVPPEAPTEPLGLLDDADLDAVMAEVPGTAA